MLFEIQNVRERASCFAVNFHRLKSFITFMTGKMTIKGTDNPLIKRQLLIHFNLYMDYWISVIHKPIKRWQHSFMVFKLFVKNDTYSMSDWLIKSNRFSCRHRQQKKKYTIVGAFIRILLSILIICFSLKLLMLIPLAPCYWISAEKLKCGCFCYCLFRGEKM